VWGFGDALTVVAEQGIIQRRTPDAIRSRVVAANEALVHLSLMVGFLAAGPVLAAFGGQATYAIGGVAALAAGVLANTVRRRAMPAPGEPEASHAERPVAPWE
jgi:MFS family permease